ncbi:arylsulfatase B [Tribolium castaneum]|uniref:Arylsulfatase J-like Protein n=1 Tax=Tribolium castaneum TaxID=7070 RepID=D2A206_TRICA|nr:PREDICTED: arylsulfatase B [Tribolium castaneum]EFA02715.1 Arylsulfatase J-like Protein [Tribolium castaneum]|eukprot:XP_015834556.1 PREDICTED: arylsulfatase B [Tribolium castaneum]
MWWLCKIIFFGSVVASFAQTKKPNIIVIVADDMGFNDVGFHGSNEIPTPNIDALAYNGVILNSHYTQALCTPSRSAFLTGKYPIHLGMQHLVILEPEPWGLPLNETILPQYLKRNGYATHAIGKWHLGFFRKEYTPTYRGFDSHFGYWQGLQDYYKHTVHATFTPEHGYDMRRNMTVDWSAQGKYSTTLFTDEAVRLIREHNTENPMFMYLAHLAPHSGNDDDPLQAPDEEIAKFGHIADPERRIYAAMVSMLDKSVGSVIAALRDKHMLENSIIVFMSDNGAKPDGIHANHGSNYPLRGNKNSAWEGAMRCVAAIWSPLIKKPQRVSNSLMHISDWLPTFYTAAGLNKTELPKMDGVDMWASISEGKDSPRTELLHNIDEIYNYGALRVGNWKYLYGSTTNGKSDGWYGSSGRDPLYTYDDSAVLASQTGSTLAGLTTYQQIKEKHQGDTNFTHKLLDSETIKTLRGAAEVKCPRVNFEEIPESKKCNAVESPCLFNIKEDPCEQINLAAERPMIVLNMEMALARFKQTALPIRNVPRDPNADPAKWNNTWVNWQDYEDVKKQKIYFNTLSPLAIGLISAAVVAFVVVIIILVTITVKSSLDKKKAGKAFFDDPMEQMMTMAPKPQIFEDRELQNRESIRNEFRTVE